MPFYIQNEKDNFQFPWISIWMELSEQNEKVRCFIEHNVMSDWRCVFLFPWHSRNFIRGLVEITTLKSFTLPIS